MKLKKRIIIPFAFFLLIAFSYFLSIVSKPVINDKIRRSAPDKFIELSRGFVQYDLKGNKNGEVVVLVSGLSVPYYCWDFLFKDLIDRGYYVLRYNHFGRGFSDRPCLKYDENLFDNQLLELLKKLEIEPPISIIGLSLGGGVAAVFSERHPELVKKICLIAPVGFPMKEEFLARLVKLPLLGDYFMAVAGNMIMDSRCSNNLNNPEEFPEFMEQFKTQLKYRNFSSSILSTLRNMPIYNLESCYKKIERLGIPLVLIWGKEDKVLPVRNSEFLLSSIPDAEFHVIKNAGHNVQYESSDIVNPIILNFLSSQNQGGRTNTK